MKFKAPSHYSEFCGCHFDQKTYLKVSRSDGSSFTEKLKEKSRQNNVTTYEHLQAYLWKIVDSDMNSKLKFSLHSYEDYSELWRVTKTLH